MNEVVIRLVGSSAISCSNTRLPALSPSVIVPIWFLISPGSQQLQMGHMRWRRLRINRGYYHRVNGPGIAGKELMAKAIPSADQGNRRKEIWLPGFY